MNEVLENNQSGTAVVVSQPRDKDGLSLKEKLGYTALGIAGVSALVYFSVKFFKKQLRDNSDKKSFEDGSPATIAKQIKMAFDNDGWWGTDTKALRQILTQIKSRKQLDEVRKEYQRQFNSQLYSDMSKELQSTEYNEMLQIMEGKNDVGVPLTSKQYEAWAKRLKAAFDKMYAFIPGTDQAAITAVLVEVPTQQAFIETGKAYNRLFNPKDLIGDLKSELGGDYLKYMQLITKKPKR